MALYIGNQKVTGIQRVGSGVSEWGDITGTLSNQTDLQNALDAKQGTLVSGVNIKTVDGKSILGEGNLATPFRNIGEIFFSTIPVTDAGAHLLDGSQIVGGGIYNDFVEYIANLYGDGTNIPNYFCTESEWQTSVTNYGVCGKFVYDSTNNTVRLPKITGFIEGTTDATTLGDLVEESLPNITGSVTAGYCYYADAQGAITTNGTGGYTNGQTIQYNTGTLNINAHNSSSTYQDNAPVQPQAIKVLYYIVIATTTKTPAEIDVDNIAQSIDKLTNLQNLTTLGNSRLQYVPFAINAGTVLNGENNTLTYSGSTITCDPCTITTADGRTKVFDTASSFDVLSDAEYKKYNVTINGALTQDKGTLSGFANSVYASLPSAWISENYDTWEMVFDITTGSDISTQQFIYSNFYNSSAVYSGVDIEIYSSKFMLILRIGSSHTTQTGTYTVLTNTRYLIRVKFTGTAYTLEYSTDNGLTWVIDINYASTTKVTTRSEGYFIIGGLYLQSHGAVETPFLGSINLNNSYIKNNSELWWQGIIDGTSSDYDYVIYSSDGNYSIFKDYETGELFFTNDFKISNLNPSTDYWLDTSTIPANLKVNGVINNNLVYIGDCTVENGGVTALTNRYFNACPYYRDLVDSYQNGTSWYAVYSDGWCEQGGGFGAEFASYTPKTVNFLKPFRDTNYSAFEMQGHTNNLECAAISNKTTGSITFGGVYNRAGLASWQACGYIN